MPNSNQAKNLKSYERKEVRTLLGEYVVVWVKTPGTLFGEDRLFIKCTRCNNLNPTAVRSAGAGIRLCKSCGKVMEVK